MDLSSDQPQPIHPRVRTVWLLATLPIVVVAGAAAGTGVGLLTGPLGGLAAALLVAGLGGWVASRWTAAAHRRWRVTLTDRALELEHGVLWRTHSTVPYARLQHVDVQRGPLETWLGMAQVRLHTASPDSDAEIPGLDVSEADALRDLLLERSGTTDAV